MSPMTTVPPEILPSVCLVQRSSPVCAVGVLGQGSWPGVGVDALKFASIGADVDGRLAVGDVRDRGRPVDVAAGDVTPGQAAGLRAERVDVAVRGAQVDAVVGDGGRRVEVAAAGA